MVRRPQCHHRAVAQVQFGAGQRRGRKLPCARIADARYRRRRGRPASHLHEPGRRVDLRRNGPQHGKRLANQRPSTSSEPVKGDRPLVKLGGDLIAITSGRLHSPPAIHRCRTRAAPVGYLRQDRAHGHTSCLTANFGSVAGWQAILFSARPTGCCSTCRKTTAAAEIRPARDERPDGRVVFSFRGMNARCWETFKGKLYFGSDAGKVMQADTGGSDGDTSIRGLVRSAYNYSAIAPTTSNFRLVAGRISRAARPVPRCKSGRALTSTATCRPWLPEPSLRQEQRGIQPPGTHSSGGPGSGRFRHWRGVNVKGSAISVHISSSTRVDQVSWFSSDVVYDQVVGAISETG